MRGAAPPEDLVRHGWRRSDCLTSSTSCRQRAPSISSVRHGSDGRSPGSLPDDNRAGFLVRETASPAPSRPRLLDRVRATIRARHYSRRTEKAYVAWIRRFILFHHKRHPAEMGGAEVTQFLSALAVDRNVAASTQNQALSAILFLYRDVLEQELPWIDDIVRSKRAAHR